MFQFTIYTAVHFDFSLEVSFKTFILESAFGIVLYRILSVSALAWSFVVINRKVCPAEFNK